MNNPPVMKATKRRLEEVDGMLADVSHLREEFTELYEKDYPQLQRCIEKLHHIIKTFEEDFRRATKGDGEVAITGGAVAGLAGVAGLALASVTFGSSLAVAVAGAGVGVAAAVGGGIMYEEHKHAKKRKMTELPGNKSAKKKRMTELRVKTELKDSQNKLNLLSEKDINERIEKLLKDLDELERDARDVSKYFTSISESHNIPREETTAMNAQMSGVKRLIGTIRGFFSGVRLLLDSLLVIENKRDEHEMETKAGKFIDGMRKVMNQLEDIMEEIRKTKEKMAK
ncbi:apolipoprotein L3-like [Pseudorasbora parva]|uniref:apolipoprotein L3-like n=1 Tax=Pseudorasbora parva TaxID=51549 RepID=UPI00351F7DA2